MSEVFSGILMEEPVMNSRLIMIVAATLTSATVFAAEPSKPAPQSPARPELAPPKVVLASADVAPASAPASQQAPATPKRRIGRVTTCRCGDQQAQPDQ